MKKRLEKMIAITAAAAMLGSMTAVCSPCIVSAADGEYDPFGAYEETVTMMVSRETDSTMDALLAENGWTYEDNPAINWYADMLNMKFVDKFEAPQGSDEYDRQVSLAMASGDLPDAMVIRDRVILEELAANDMIEDLTDAYNNYGSDELKAGYESYGSAVLDDVTYDGKMVAMPSALYGVQNVPLVWIRQDWLDELGLTVDEDGDFMISRDELEAVAREFMEKDPGGSGNPVGITNVTDLNSEMYLSIYGSFGSYPEKWLRTDDNAVTNGSIAPETKEALSYLHGLYEEGLLDPQFGTRTAEDIQALAGNGQLGIYFSGWWDAYPFMNAFELGDKNVKVSCFGLGSENGKVPVPSGDNVQGYVVVRKGYEHPEAVVKLFNLRVDSIVYGKQSDPDFKSTEYYDLIVSGKVLDSILPLSNIYVFDNDDLVEGFYQPVLDYLAGNITEEEFPQPFTNEQFLETYKTYTENESTPENIDGAVWVSYAGKFVGIKCLKELGDRNLFEWRDVIYTAPTETMMDVQADLEKLTEETFVKIIVGELSADDFDAYVEEWNALGGGQVCEELTEKLD